MAYERSKSRYKKFRTAPASPAFDRSNFTGALYRALAKFPEARNAVIAEFDRIEAALSRKLSPALLPPDLVTGASTSIAREAGVQRARQIEARQPDLIDSRL